MLRGKKRRYVLALLASLTLGVGLFVGTTAHATGVSEPIGLLPVDKSKGIEYIYNAGGTVTGVNLNGNSVIIKESANSTSETPLINFYIDTDKDGVIDEGENVEMVGNATDVSSSLSIYGVYQQSSIEKIVITVESGVVSYLYGVYDGEIVTADSPAITMNYSSADSATGVYVNVIGVFNSTVNTTTATATLIDINVTEGNLYQLVGAWNSNLNAGSNTNVAVDVDITQNATVTSRFQGVIGDSVTSKVTGNVNVDVKAAQLPDATAVNFSYGHVLQGCELDGSVEFHATNVRMGAFFGLQNAWVKGNYIFDVDSTCEILTTFYGMKDSTVDGNATINWKGSSVNSNSTSEIYGIHGRYQSLNYMVGGDCNVSYLGGQAGTIYGIYGVYTSDGYSSIKGNVKMNIQDGTIGNAYGLYNATVAEGKNTTFTVGRDVSEDDEKETNTIVISGEIRATNYATLGGDCSVYIYNNNTANSYASCSAIYDTDIAGSATVVVKGGYYKYIIGLDYYVVVEEDANIKMSNINSGVNVSTLSYNSSYGVYYATIKGNVELHVDDLNLYTFYGLQSATCTGKITGHYNNISVNYSFYGANMSSGFSGADIILTDVDANSGVYGLHASSTIIGDISCKMNNVNSKNYLYGIEGSSLKVNGDVTCNITNSSASGMAYGVTNISIQEGTLAVNIIENGEDDNIAGESAVADTYFTLTAANSANATGAITITIDGITTTNPLYPYNAGGSSDNGDVTIAINNLTHKTTAPIGNTTSKGQNLTMTIDGNSSIPEGTTITPGSSNGGMAIASYNGAVYYSGEVIFDNLTENNIYLNPGSYKIPAGVTIKANSNIYLKYNSSLLVEGTLDGNIVEMSGSLYINGGKVTADTSSYSNVFYPLDTTYTSGKGTVSTSSTTSHTLCTDRKFAKKSNTISYTVKPDTGYCVKEAKVVTESSKPVEVSDSGTTYSFSMPDEAATFDLVFEGKDLVLGKSMMDPIVKIGQTYDATAPVYDLGSVLICNDATKGTVSYAIDETAKLPEGLYLEGSLICGTIAEGTVETEQIVRILVTGKNGSIATLSLNFIVTNGEGTQTSQDGRVIVDDEKKEVYLCGNSVIFESHADGTAIFLDDNKDGAADFADPAITGDFSTYTVYGVYGVDVKNAVKITVNGGSIGTIYGVYGNKITNTGTSLDVQFNGGSVSKFYTLGNSASVSGTKKVIIGENATVSTSSVGSNAKGYYYDKKGVITINGQYTVKEEINATSVTTNNSSTVSFTKPVTVAGAITLNASSSSYASTITFGKDATVSASTLTVGPYVTATFNGEVNAAEINLNATKNTTVFAKAVKATTSITMASSAKAEFKSTVNTATLTTNSSSNTIFGGVVTIPTMSLGASSTTSFDGAVTSTNAIAVGDNTTATFNDTLTVKKLTLSKSTSKVFVNKDSTVSSQVSTSGQITIGQNVTMTVDYFYDSTGSKTYLKGALVTNSLYNSGNFYMMDGGSISDTVTANFVYYPITIKSNVKNTTITFNTNIVAQIENVTYLRAGSNSAATATEVEGYNYSFKVDGEAVEGMKIPMPKKNAVIEIVYTPTQIALSKSFAEPTGSVGVTYTEEQPLYDLKDITITNDTTDAYGTDVAYVVNKDSSLPKGLSLENGKVIGTPEIENSAGDIVTFDITGRNGTTATIDILITILAEGYKPVDINETVSVGYSVIDLQGTSIVMYPDVKDSTKVSIYPDYNADGKPDNNIALKVNGENAYDLSNYYIYGYRNTETPYNGNISITMLGGKVTTIYGVSGESALATDTVNYATVNGKIRVDVRGGTVKTNAYAARYAKVENVELKVTGGIHDYADFYAVKNSEIEEDVTFVLGGTARIYEGSKSNPTSYNVNVRGVDSATVGRDVNITIGFDGGDYGFRPSKQNNSYDQSYFRGVYASAIGRDVNVTIDGAWIAKKENTFVYGGTVAGDVNVNWRSGKIGDSYWTDTTYYAYDTTITGDMNVTVAEKASIQSSYDEIYALYRSTANGVYTYVPDSCSHYITNYNVLGGTGAKIETYAYSYNQGYVQIAGNYTIADDLSITSLYVLEDSNVTIAKGSKVSVNTYKTQIHEGATLTNNGEFSVAKETIIDGILDNYGTFKNTYVVTMNEGSKIINRENATWDVAAGITNNSAIYNYGEFNQTYSDTSLGNIYTTKEVVLYGTEDDYITDTNLYYPYVVDYPEQCVGSVEFNCASITTSARDNIEYVKAGSTFTITPGTKLIDTVELASVTYGTNGSATEQMDGTWQGVVPFEPFTVTLNYSAAEDVTKIQISPATDSIDNSLGNMLVVDKEYTADNPLYDLTTIQVSQDTVAEGSIVYSVDSNSLLPSGLVLKDGKLYGKLKEANSSEQTIQFIVKGRNQTSAVFTLILGEVKKCVPEWSVPDNDFRAIVNQTLANVGLPTSQYGTYSWKNASASVGSEATTLENIELLFTPNDTDNYDWETAARKVGATYEAGVVTCKVSVKVGSGVPTYITPTNLSATYGQTFGDVKIPSGNNDGQFTWEYSDSKTVGSVGEHTYYVKYTPNNANYQIVTGIEVTLTVNKAIPTFDKIETLSSDCAVQLKNIALPSVNNGSYYWITTADAVPVSGRSYQLGFTPNDTANYNWQALDEWNDMWNCIVFPVKVVLNHNLAEDWISDDTYHWKDCNNDGCTEKASKETHTWDKEEIVTPATENTEGLKKCTCKCGVTKTEPIAKLSHTTHVYGNTWSSDDYNHWHVCTANGCNNTSTIEPHTWDVGVVTVEATATATGIKTYTCTVCGKTKTQSIPATGGAAESVGPTESALIPTVGTVLAYNDTNADYIVTNTSTEAPEVSYKFTNKSATSATIPDAIVVDGVTYKVTSIANNAFKNHKKIKTVKMGANITTVGKNAFYGCKKLTTVKMGKSVEVIGDGAFQNCTALKKIEIPSTINKIGKKAFYGCKKITNITIKTTKLTTKNVGKDAFKKAGSNNYKKLTVKVPKKKLKSYKTMLKKRGLSAKAKVKK